MKENCTTDNRVSSDNIFEGHKAKPFSLINCFICGMSYKSSKFTSHYLQCKKSFENTLLGKERHIIEHPSFISLMDKLVQGRDYSIELEDYNQISEEEYFNLFAKECPKCHDSFMPDGYLKHSEKCKKRSSLNAPEFEGIPNLDQQGNSKNEKHQLRRRKSSMENLKSLTKDELKGFKKFNIKLIADKMER